MDVFNFFAYFLAICIIYKTIRWLVGKIKIKSIKDKSILITGCDTGFGHDAAIRFSQMGFQVFAGCYVKETLAYFDSYSPKGGNIIPFQLDVSNEQSVKDAGVFVRSKLKKGKGLWAIINNAGIRHDIGPLLMLKRKSHEKVLAVNLHGVMDVTREFLPLVIEEKGRVVNMSSLSGILAAPLFGGYTVSKHGVEGFSDCLRREMYHFGVSVHIVEPGYFKTNISTLSGAKRIIKDVYAQASPEIRKLYGDDNYIVKAMARMERATSTHSPNTDLVVDAYVHAATSIVPHLRYPVGPMAFRVTLLQHIPTRLADFIIRLNKTQHPAI